MTFYFTCIFSLFALISARSLTAEYSTFDDSGLTVHYVSRHESLAKASLTILKEARQKIATHLKLSADTAASVILVPSKDQFYERISPKFGHLRVLGVANSEEGQILINLSKLLPGSHDPLVDTLTHEMTHIMLRLYERENGVRLPRWFHEGVSSWLGRIFPLHPEEDRQLRAAANQSTLIPFYELDHSFPEFRSDSQLAYLQSEHFIRYLVRQHGEDAIARILKAFAGQGELRTAVPDALRVDIIDEENKWRKSIKSRFPLLSIITNYMSLWTAGAFLTLVSFWLYRRRRKRLFAKWEEEQAPLLVEEEQPPEP